MVPNNPDKVPTAKETIIVYKMKEVKVPADIAPEITRLPPYHSTSAIAPDATNPTTACPQINKRNPIDKEIQHTIKMPVANVDVLPSKYDS